VFRRRPWLLALLVPALALPAASWYFAGRSESDEPEEVPSAVGFASDQTEPKPAQQRPTKVRTFMGLQTTVPETLGLDEATAVYKLEEGGFRVRLMERIVSDPRKDGIVIQQLPLAGLTRRVGWIVTIVVGRLR